MGREFYSEIKIAQQHKTGIIAALRKNEPSEAVKAIQDHIMKYWNEESTYPCIQEEKLLHSWDGAA